MSSTWQMEAAPRKPINIIFIVILAIFSAYYIGSLNAVFPNNEYDVLQKSTRLAKSPLPSAPSLAHTIMDILSASSFPIDSQSNKLALSPKIKTVVFDIGARSSDYLTVMERNPDPTVALILVDPLPDSSIPLMKRVAEYSMQGYKGGEDFLDQDRSRQVFLLRAAVGKEERIINLNVAAAPACTSILNTSAKNDFWCANHHHSIKMLKIPLITLHGLLEVLPPHVPNIHVKIDTEGADLAVLQGAGNMLQKVDTVIIECNNDAINVTFRDDECMASTALKYMADQGFNTSHVEGQGELVNIFFARNDYVGPLPEYLRQGGLALRSFYNWFVNSAGYNGGDGIQGAAAVPPSPQ